MQIASRLIIFFLIIFCSCEQPGTAVETEIVETAHVVPDPRDAIIYQINPRAFSEEGNLQGILPRLDSIKSLGANVIYIMPIYPIGQENSVNSPYCIRDYTAVNEEFGSLEDLQAVVDGAHERGMAVIMDWVANHTAYDHPWTSNKDWYLQDEEGNIISPPETGWDDVAQLNFNNDDMRQEMIAAMKFWIDKANIDGFRCDYSDGPPFDFWQHAIDTLRGLDESRPLLFLSEGTRVDHFAAGFDYNFGFEFFHSLVVDIFKDGQSVTKIDSVNAIEYEGDDTGDKRMVRYTTNHDVNLGGVPQERFGGEKGAMAAFVVAAYMKAVPMIYNGQEIGIEEHLEFFSKTPINWQESNEDVLAAYKKILSFYQESEVLRRGTMDTYDHDDIAVFTMTHGGKKVLVMVNLRDQELSYAIPESLNQIEWKEQQFDSSLSMSDNNTDILLPAYAYRIFSN